MADWRLKHPRISGRLFQCRCIIRMWVRRWCDGTVDDLLRHVMESVAALGKPCVWGARLSAGSIERESRRVSRKCIHAQVDIPKGTRITAEMLITRRPGTDEISAIDWYGVIGRRARRDIGGGAPLKTKDVWRWGLFRKNR